MDLRQYHDAPEFSRLVTSTLEVCEAENNLVIGVIGGIISGAYAASSPFLAVASPSRDPSTSTISAVVVRTPPFPVLIAYTETAVDDSMAKCVTWGLHETFGNDIGGFNSDARQIEPYVYHWCNLTGTVPYVSQRTRIYKATRVVKPKSVRGTPRRARPDDYAVILGFLREFFKETLPDELDEERCRTLAKQYLTDAEDRRGVLLWVVDEDIVSMAAYLGPTPHGVRIDAVYTAPDRRRRGFASACVASLTQQLLDGGRRYCFLFTDLENPTSNKIYVNMGYIPISDQLIYRFNSAT